MRRESTPQRALVGAVIAGAVALTLLPILWLVIIAFQSPKAIISPGWTFEFSLDNVSSVFAPTEVYGTQVINSIILVLSATTLCLIVSTLAGYSLSQLGWSRRFVIGVVAAAGVMQVIPVMTLVPGLFAMLVTYGLVESLLGLVVLNTVFHLPFAVIMSMFYFNALPAELRESASMDGASEFAIFRQIMLPLARPGIAAIGIFTAILIWNEFLFGLVFTTGGTSSPITVGIASLVQPQEIKWGPMAAVGMVTAAPIIVLAIVANRQIVAGLTRGAVKG